MANFIIQSDDIKTLDIERYLLLEQIRKSHGLHDYVETALNKDFNKYIDYIPVGTIEFVTNYLKTHYGFDKQNPIEIPKYLRTDEFLKRDYKIVKGSELPRKGHYFIKNASTLKDFSYCGELEYFIFDEMFEEPKHSFDSTLRLNKDDLFVVSSDFHPESEYRVYVFNHQIEAIANYDGDPSIFPDVKIIKKAINLIRKNEEWLKSYTIDVFVNHKDTAIIEIHDFSSCGIYTTLLGSGLIYAYRDGIDYLLYDNKTIEI